MLFKEYLPTIQAIKLLFRLTAAAMARYEDVKARSLTGLAHVVDTRTKLVLDVRIAPLTIVVSENGIFNEKKRNLIADLGLLTITTLEEDAVVETSLSAVEVCFLISLKQS